jgi:signal transduction histidine kinase
MVSVGDNMMFPAFAAAWRRPADGKWVVLRPARPWLSPWQLRLLIGFAITALMLAPLAWWTARRVTRPIHLFASAADRLGRDPNAPPLVPTGPAEVRIAVSAFNDMQDKLRRYVDDRTAMVAAIAHDLRTPLMRLRFRIEAAPEDIRARTVADIEQMDAMISAALTFARGEAAQAERVRLDLSSLVASVVDDMADTGTPVEFAGGKPVLIDGDALGLKRMIANLIVNAVKFGDRARVTLKRDKTEAVLTIDDDGPGLAEDQLERVFDPFYRADASRSAGGGFGLGLSAARAVAQAHGGEIRLANREGGGLRATVRLPLA